MDSMTSGVIPFCSGRVWACGQASEAKKQLMRGYLGHSCGELTLGIQTLGDSLEPDCLS